jgi:hypothetical protein
MNLALHLTLRAPKMFTNLSRFIIQSTAHHTNSSVQPPADAIDSSHIIFCSNTNEESSREDYGDSAPKLMSF